MINKRLKDEDILRAASILQEVGIPNIKMYFMLGLPYEEDEDIESTVKLIEQVREIMGAQGRKIGRLGTLTASFSTFVPKPFTPFEWCSFTPKETLMRRRRLLKKGLSRLPNLRVKFDSIREAHTQAILSRGDRRLAHSIKKSSLDRTRPFEKAIKESGIPVDRYLTEIPLTDGPLPWEIVGTRVQKAYLKEEFLRSHLAKETMGCIFKGCKKCGACEVLPDG